MLDQLAALEGQLYPWTRQVKTYQALQDQGYDVSPLKWGHDRAYAMSRAIHSVMWEMMAEVYSMEDRIRESHEMVERFDVRIKADLGAEVSYG